MKTIAIKVLAVLLFLPTMQFAAESFENDEVVKLVKYMEIANEEDIKEFTGAIKTDDLNKKLGLAEQGLLHIAVAANCLPIARSLLEKKANVDLPNKAGLTPLFVAGICKNERMMQLLLQNGARKEELPGGDELLSHLKAIDDIEKKIEKKRAEGRVNKES